jgi:hypothetical protein
MSNGLYDFVLAYYNPMPQGGTHGADHKALLPNWQLSGLTLDGRYNGGVSSRNIGGATADSSERKAASTGNGYQQGEPRSDFIGSITSTMAQYMCDKFGINQFCNTNILGDYIAELTTKTYKNVAFIGDKSNLNTFYIQSEGVIDIVG